MWLIASVIGDGVSGGWAGIMSRCVSVCRCVRAFSVVCIGLVCVGVCKCVDVCSCAYACVGVYCVSV